jgi:hypothetical protein
MKQVSDNLAGRLSLVELPLVLIEELDGNRMDGLWLRGGSLEAGIRQRAGVGGTLRANLHQPTPFDRVQGHPVPHALNAVWAALPLGGKSLLQGENL